MTPDEKEEVLTGLLSNGIRHLERGLRGFESGELEFAVTDAFFGIEIMMKALVFDGQWELIFDEPGDADMDKLRTGNVRTIGFDAAEKRLKNLIKKPLPKTCHHFKVLQKHRNKLIHFFHPELLRKSGKVQVARELANAWSALRELRNLPDFEPVFFSHAAEFHTLDARLLVIDGYLDQEAARIRSAVDCPYAFKECPACKRETFDGVCAICDYNEPSPKDLTEGDELVDPIDCPECGGGETVVVFGTGSRCTSCGAGLEPFDSCEYCGGHFLQSATGEEEGSFLNGCHNCSGRLEEVLGRDT